jgi:hypothetical protein
MFYTQQRRRGAVSAETHKGSAVALLSSEKTAKSDDVYQQLEEVSGYVLSSFLFFCFCVSFFSSLFLLLCLLLCHVACLWWHLADN